MDFLFYVPFFCTAAAAVTEILNVCCVNIELFERKKLILNQVKRASHFVKIRLCKDHFKNDLRSDQDHRQKIDLRSRSRSRFFKNDLRSRLRS
jgi:hypothetical protein